MMVQSRKEGRKALERARDASPLLWLGEATFACGGDVGSLQYLMSKLHWLPMRTPGPEWHRADSVAVLLALCAGVADSVVRHTTWLWLHQIAEAAWVKDRWRFPNVSHVRAAGAPFGSTFEEMVRYEQTYLRMQGRNFARAVALDRVVQHLARDASQHHIGTGRWDREYMTTTDGWYSPFQLATAEQVGKIDQLHARRPIDGYVIARRDEHVTYRLVRARALKNFYEALRSTDPQ